MRPIAVAPLLLPLLLLAATTAQAGRTAPMGTGAPGIETEEASITCPGGRYLAGLELDAEPQIYGVRAFCGAMSADGLWDGVPALVTEDTSFTRAYLGEGKASSHRILVSCPRDFFVAGYQGYTQVTGIHSITELTLTCLNVKTEATTTASTPYDNGLQQVQWPYVPCERAAVAIGAFGTVHLAEVLEFGLACVRVGPAVSYGAKLTAPTTAAGGLGKAITPETSFFKPGIESGPSTALVPKPAPAAETFAPPLTASGARLYACETVGGGICGRPVADAFCRQQSFVRAQSFKNGGERVAGETLAGERCAKLKCNVFTQIVCTQ
jgi:hypothetical protein